MIIDTASAVARLLAARDDHRTLAPFTDTAPGLTLDQAYVVQRGLEDALAGRGERVIGWKAGFTNAAVQQGYGAREPVAGFMLASGVFASGDPVPVARFAGVGVEVEVAFLLRCALSGPGVTPASALLAIEGAMPALELIDIRFSGKPRAEDMVADGVAANAIVLGRPLTSVAGMDLALEGVVYELNGEVVATNAAAEVLGSPLNSLAWLANRLGALGRGLRPGDVVLSGSISKILRPKAGDAIRASFTRLGSVSCRFV